MVHGWVTSEMQTIVTENMATFLNSPVSPVQLASLVQAVREGNISRLTAKEVRMNVTNSTSYYEHDLLWYPDIKEDGHWRQTTGTSGIVHTCTLVSLIKCHKLLCTHCRLHCQKFCNKRVKFL